MRSAIGKPRKTAMKGQCSMHTRTRSRRSLLGSAILLLILTLSGATACTGPAAAPPPTPTPLPLPDKLTFYDWAEDMPQPVLDAFEAEYGIKVNYQVYESQEQAIDRLKGGQRYDVVVMESRFIPMLANDRLLASIDRRNIPNYKNISASFRNLLYDPGNKYSIPYNWGTTGLVVRSDLLPQVATRWADLWDPRYAGKVGIWRGQPREVIALTLKSLGHSANSESPMELEAALQQLLKLKPQAIFLEDVDPATSAPALADGRLVMAMGYASDVLLGREQSKAITYALPQEGALLWGDTFVIPAGSPNQHAAELFLNFLLRPEISAQIANENHYATANEAARALIERDILNDPVIFPTNESMKNAELILPLSAKGQKLYDDIWARFMAAGQ